MHYICNVVVERIVLENLKEVIRYVSDYEDDFVRMVMDADMKQKGRELALQKRRLAEIQKRIGELDKIIVHAPDKSSGRRLQEIEIIYNHIGEFDCSKVTLWKGNAV